jgi:hypothetical protein
LKNFFFTSAKSRASTASTHGRGSASIVPWTVPPLSTSIAGAPKRALQLRSLLSGRSFERHVHERHAFQAALDRMCGRSHFDVVQIEHSFMAQFRFPATPALVLDEHNVEHEIRSRTLAEMMERRPEEVIRLAVKGMLPRNRLARKQITKLKVYAGPDHPHQAQKPVPYEISQVAQ